jgi:hypothetical protein
MKGPGREALRWFLQAEDDLRAPVKTCEVFSRAAGVFSKKETCCSQSSSGVYAIPRKGRNACQMKFCLDLSAMIALQ